MRQTNTTIPVNTMADISGNGIAIGRESFDEEMSFDHIQNLHRDDYHLLLLQEEGTTDLEIDFEKYQLGPKSIICVYPSQVHRIGPVSRGKISFCIIDNESLHAKNLALLSEITPLRPLLLEDGTFQMIIDAVSLCIRLLDDKEQKLHQFLVKESCNVFVALVISQYLALLPSHDKLTRLELITKSFKRLLEHNFVSAKRPGDYSKELNITAGYLYECVKKTTGFSVSYHIEQRVILEAKRLLYYSDRSVKQIAFDLGFVDYPYFTRLFGKATGMTPVAFRRKNLD